MGIVSFRRVEKVHILQEKFKELVDFYHEIDFWACFADLPQEGLKKSVWKES